MMQLYEYACGKVSSGNGLFEETADYLIKVPCQNRPDILDYIFRSYRYDEWMYITDIFPAIFKNDKRCFKRFTSREGYFVNMRRLAVTCVVAFVRETLSRNPMGVMVISGSYEDGESQEDPSRKLRLYNYFFRSVISELGLREVDAFEENAFMLLREDNPLTDIEISSKYKEFKTKRQ